MAGGSGGGLRIPNSLRPIIYVALIIAFATAGVSAWRTYQTVQVQNDPHYQQGIVGAYGLDSAHQKRLDKQFEDKDGDFLADPPTDPAKLVDPPDLGMACLHSDKDTAEPIDWKTLGKQIGDATGKTVNVTHFTNLSEEIENIKASKVQIVILHAAETPYLVNHFGFIPFAISAGDHGPNGHRLTIIAKPKSPIMTAADIKGHDLACTHPLSISGYRAAIAYLHEAIGLRPDFDYHIVFSDGQKESILGVTTGPYDVAAASSDKLSSMTDKGEITPDQYRVVYESEVIPRFAIGYFYNLNPDTAAKLKQATLAFVNSPDPNDDDPPVRFQPAVYAKDFATVRTIDNAFDPRLTMPAANGAGTD